MRLLAIVGSLRTGSHNARLMRAAVETLPPGVIVEPWDGVATLPIFDEDAETDPPAAVVAEALAAVARADAVLIATPEYNGAIPGGLKNALDWASRPFATNVFRGKPVAVISTSPGIFGAVWAQADVRRVLGAMGAAVVDTEVAVPQAETAFADDGQLVDADQAAALAALVGELLSGVGVSSSAGNPV